MSATPQAPERPHTTQFIGKVLSLLAALEISTHNCITTMQTGRGTLILQVYGPKTSRISWGMRERPDSEVLDAVLELHDHVGVFIARVICTGDVRTEYRRSRRGFALDDRTWELDIALTWIEELVGELDGPRLEPYAPAP